MNLYKEEKVRSDKFMSLKEPGEELIYMAPNKPAVKALQSFLNEEGYKDQNNETLAENGSYDTSTANAVLRYQQAEGSRTTQALNLVNLHTFNLSSSKGVSLTSSSALKLH